MAALSEDDLRKILGEGYDTSRQLVSEQEAVRAWQRHINFRQAVTSGFTKSFEFSGRASRSEYWYWFLFTVLGSLIFQTADVVLFNAPFTWFTRLSLSPLHGTFNLIVLVPSLALEVRRLHDVDRSGWWLLMSLTIVGSLYPLLVWKLTKGTDGSNRFGPDSLIDPKTAEVFA